MNDIVKRLRRLSLNLKVTVNLKKDVSFLQQKHWSIKNE